MILLMLLARNQSRSAKLCYCRPSVTYDIIPSVFTVSSLPVEVRRICIGQEPRPPGPRGQGARGRKEEKGKGVRIEKGSKEQGSKEEMGCEEWGHVVLLPGGRQLACAGLTNAKRIQIGLCVCKPTGIACLLCLGVIGLHPDVSRRS